MERKIELYKRKHRSRCKIVIIGAEGKNVTEKNYFKKFSSRNLRVIMATGNATDPFRMVKNIITAMQNEGIDAKLEDVFAYCVFDTDTDRQKDKQIEKAVNLAGKFGIEIITSNPCFEDWLLCHFEQTHAILDNKDVIRKLKKYISNYDKNIDVYPKVQDLTDIAIKNAKSQCQYQLSLKRKIHSVDANPSTEVYKIIEKIKNNK